MTPLALAALSLSVTALLAGCGSTDGTETAYPVETVTVFETAQATTPASEPERADSPTEGDGVEEAAAGPDAVESTAAGDLITVPDVVGKDHQLAQDTMQAAGLYNLSEEDASGEGRLLLLDRNWTTVAQDPAAGERVPSDTAVVLRAVKDGEV